MAGQRNRGGKKQGDTSTGDAAEKRPGGGGDRSGDMADAAARAGGDGTAGRQAKGGGHTGGRADEDELGENS